MKAGLQTVLDRHYDAVEKIILSRQHPVTGLLPASTAVNAHGDYTDAWVRDNVYSILCVWGLGLAYRRNELDSARGYALGQSVVKLMRGLLSAMMRQADRVEAFKVSLNPIDALHAKYGTDSGLAVVGDDEWGHLQLDATSLFLLMLGQMTASGLRIVFTLDEANFVQNLVHYISRTYCTADYGIWERGNKINHGTAEVNCSSVGMAKAALEALEGLNLFGDVSGREAVIHVVPNDIARSRLTLHGLLPRESTSKETDAALLSIIGYPAYAIEDTSLVEKTRRKIIKKLAGRYGCKRFLLDGHQSAIEDTSRLHYEPSELREFKDIESEWPLFFTYLLLDALMRGDAEAVAQWRGKLEPLFIEVEGQRLLPELYYVPETAIAAEKAAPGSQERVANENLPLVWAQSLYMLSEMVLDGILEPDDLDPLRRRARLGQARRLKVGVVLIAEDVGVQLQLAQRDCHSQTIDALTPVKLMHAVELSKVHGILGKNAKLGLSGRPFSLPRSITTAQMHYLGGEPVLFLPYYFDPRGFYFTYDNRMLVEHFRSSLRFLSLHWDREGDPVIPFMVRGDMLEDQSDELFRLLAEMGSGVCNDVAVRLAPLTELMTTVATERIDDIHGVALQTIRPGMHPRAEYLPDRGERVVCGDAYDALSNEELSRKLSVEGRFSPRVDLLATLWKRHGAGFEIPGLHGGVQLQSIAESCYEQATALHDWASVRRIAELMGVYDERLEDALLEIVIQQKRLAVGRAYYEQATFFKPHESSAIVKTIATYCGHNAAESILTQEIVLHLGHLIRIEPELFRDILTLRTWYLIQLIVGRLGQERNISVSEAYGQLLELPPHELYERLRSVLSSFDQAASDMLGEMEHFGATGLESINGIHKPSAEEASELQTQWRQWRIEAGMIGRLSLRFYKRIWYLLQQCDGLVIGDKYDVANRMGSELTHDATAGEQVFQLRVDGMLQGIEMPEYRQLNIEALESLAKLFEKNPEMQVHGDLVMDVLIGHAVRIAWCADHADEAYDEERSRAWEAFYALSPREAEKALIEAFIHLIYLEGDAAS